MQKMEQELSSILALTTLHFSSELRLLMFQFRIFQDLLDVLSIKIGAWISKYLKVVPDHSIVIEHE
jgi:hypothetical protein